VVYRTLLYFDKYLSFIEKIADIPDHGRNNNYRDHVYGDIAGPEEKPGGKRFRHAGKQPLPAQVGKQVNKDRIHSNDCKEQSKLPEIHYIDQPV